MKMFKINDPCNEDWSKMTQNEIGRHCALCQKSVHDFTKMTNEEIVNVLKGSKNICGRFREDQLNKPFIEKPRLSFRRVMVLGSLIAFSSLNASPLNNDRIEVSQSKLLTVKGLVIDSESRKSLNEVKVSVFFKGKKVSEVLTNQAGEFSFQIKESHFDKISVKLEFEGYESLSLSNVSAIGKMKIELSKNPRIADFTAVVKDEKGELLPFANITVFRDGKIISGAYTDFEGRFSIKDKVLPSDEIEVSFVGYEALKQLVLEFPEEVVLKPGSIGLSSCEIVTESDTEEVRLAVLGKAAVVGGISSIVHYSTIEVEPLDEEIEEVELVQFSSVYPNPASEYFDVEFDEEGHYMLELYDLNSKLIYTKELNSNFIRVNVLSFAKGSYVLNIRDFNTQETNSHKVLVQ